MSHDGKHGILGGPVSVSYAKVDTQFSSVQFKMVSTRSGNTIICTPLLLSTVLPVSPFKLFQYWSD